jgi:hypothetical protein
VCDPWLVGKAFNNGWALLSPSAAVDFSKVDYIWISHQHPDHLNFPSLKSIPAQQRRRITILYQHHSSARMVRVFRGLGFGRVIELPLHRWQKVGDLELVCGSVGTMDSWIAIRAEGDCVLNLNDCVLSQRHLEDVRKLVGRVSLLFTQFSFANWIGNHRDEKGEVPRKLAEVRQRVNLFSPEATVAFASFVFFCNQENHWMNDFMITPHDVLAMGLPGVNFMYPGDIWDSSTRTFTTLEAIKKYDRDRSRMVIDAVPSPVSMDKVLAAGHRMLRNLETRFGRFLIRRLDCVDFYLHDHDKVLRIVPSSGVCELSDDPELKATARYVMCSQVAWFTLAFTWGWAAMEVSGMYLDREFGRKSDHKIAFYLNLLSTEFLDLRDSRRAARTIRTLWSKRREITYRLLGQWGLRRLSHSHKTSSQQLVSARQALD